ncbi:hypothetical protein PYW07_007322 [Mythimna separata]|uniref:Dynein heavy chain tail domain-containing protein n=1 Tax=Mythimna separata TaxID=271217 RepID=A0AAD8DZX4_MYTSE|nr:hypothetical protein PYW07_007322 [Mythimna separata]
MDEPDDGAPRPSQVEFAEQPPPDLDAAEATDDTDEVGDIGHPIATKASSIRRLSFSDGEAIELDKTTLEAILDVSSRLADIQMRSRLSMSALTQGHETYKDKQAKAKEARNNRVGGIKQQHRFLLETCASLLDKSVEYILDYYFALIDMNQETDNVVSGICKTMQRVYIPALKTCRGWGDINPPNPHSTDIINTYISKLMLFVDYLAKTKIDLDCCTRFKIDLNLYEDELSDEEKMKNAITKTQVLEEICSYVKQWIRQITMVLVQSQQLRREPSNIGPLAELDHWRRQLTTFTSIIEHIKSVPTAMYIHTLIRAKSKLLKKWRQLDNMVTDYYNEAFDNVKYLYALEKYCEPLYRCDPSTTQQFIPGLLYSIRMIFATSRYYNTTKQISTLLVKVTNQILNMCMDFLTNGGKKNIWNQDKLHFIHKAKNTQRCIKLYNVLTIVFTEFELIYHYAWAENVGQVRLGLIAPLLIRHPTTNMYIINFSIYIPECIREVEYMWQLGLRVPDESQIVAFCKDKIFANYERIKYLVDRNNQVRRSMPKLYLPLLRAQLIKLENAFQPGFSTITWTSLEIASYCDKIEKTLDEVDLFVKEVVDMKEARIDAILKSITTTLLVRLPKAAVDPQVFYEENLVRRDEIAAEIQQKSWNAELAVMELINKFLDSVPSAQIRALKNNWLDIEKALKQVTSATRVIPEDSGSRSKSSMGLRNYFRMVSEHKDIVRSVMALQGMMFMYKPDIEKLLKGYGRFSHLWAEDRVQQVQDFVDSNPMNVLVKDMLNKYEGQTEEVLVLPDRHIIGSIQIDMGNIKLALHLESVEWKRTLGKLLCQSYKDRVMKLMQFIKDRMKTLGKKIKDLDDVRVAMLCLERIREEFIG